MALCVRCMNAFYFNGNLNSVNVIVWHENTYERKVERSLIRKCREAGIECLHLNDDHLLVVDFHLDVDGVILDVLQCGHRVDVGELLGTETGIAVRDRTT